VPAPAGLSIRRLGPDETSLHAMVASPVFDIDEEITLALVNPGTLRLDTVRCYAGERDGQPVVTGMSVTVGGCTAILNVATLPGLRGLGYGTALTARAVADGLAAGSACCWLQSSPDGYHVYQKLGFQTIESWPYYSA
jgi:predicted GNAT family acetyltransferase